MNFKQGIRDGMPICLGYFSVSLAFGVLAVGSGLTVLESLLISMMNLTSAGQFAGLSIIVASGSLIEMVLSQLVINARYALMSIALSQKVDADFGVTSRCVLGFAVTDEIFAVAVGQKSVSRIYFAGLALMPFIGWSAGTLCGALLGSILPPIVTGALGIALYGMFVAIVVPVAKREKSVLIVVCIAVALSSLFTYAPVLSGISGGFSVVICTVIAAALGAAFMPVKEDA